VVRGRRYKFVGAVVRLINWASCVCCGDVVTPMKLSEAAFTTKWTIESGSVLKR
jgi:hypothetical protein